MALTRQTLAQAGGLQAVANHLGDDQVMGRLVQAKGYSLTLANVIPATTVPESNFRELYSHELRWARTIRALVPLAYTTLILQMSLFWAVICVVVSTGYWAAWILFFATLLIRHRLARRIDAALRLTKAGDAWMFVLRDMISATIYIASFLGNNVNWRGQQMRTDQGKATAPGSAASTTPRVEPLL
jgi:ceramide glucosyltransferase